MKIAQLKIKKRINADVVATQEKVNIKFPKQSLGNIAIFFRNDEKTILLKQFELILNGDDLKVVRL